MDRWAYTEQNRAEHYAVTAMPMGTRSLAALPFAGKVPWWLATYRTNRKRAPEEKAEGEVRKTAVGWRGCTKYISLTFCLLLSKWMTNLLLSHIVLQHLCKSKWSEDHIQTLGLGGTQPVSAVIMRRGRECSEIRTQY